MNPLRYDPAASRNFTALLCIASPEMLSAATDQLAPLGFEVQTVATPEQALAHLYSHPCDVVVVSDDFGGGDAEAHPLLSQIASVPLDLRRKFLLLLIGPSLTPRSSMQAFALSVDLVLRPEDIPNLKGIVGQGLADRREFYATFNAVHQNLLQEG